MRVLVVSPGFHGYASSLERTLVSLGYDARAHVYDHAHSAIDRVGIRALHTRPQSAQAHTAQSAVSDRAMSVLREHRPDAVLVVRGDLLDDRWWEALESSKAKRVVWFYDELRRMRYTADRLQTIGPIATYSPLDAAVLQQKGLPARCVPLAFDALQPVDRRSVPAVTMIGARYPSRESVMRRLTEAGVPTIAYGRDWSRHPLDVLRTRFFTHPGSKTARQLDRSAAYGVMQGSIATLNLHGDQDGFTMRTFEAAGVGGVQICDRTDVAQFYEVVGADDPSGEVFAFRDEAELTTICQRIIADSAFTERIRARARAHTLAHHTLAHRLAELAAMWA